MVIFIDADLDIRGNVIAFHTVDTSDKAVNCPESPTPNVPMTGLQYYAFLQANKQCLESHGYNIKSKLPTAQGRTRWQIIVDECNAFSAPTPESKLNLTY
jgi:hypothetical protein